jgi:hypothetical protein
LYETEDDFLANFDIYPNVKHLDTQDINIKDNFLRALVSNSPVSIGEGSVLITGERFIDFDKSEAISYLLAFDLLRFPGTYHLKIDKNNVFPHYFMLDMLAEIDDEYFSVGTIVNSPGPTECLYKSNLGTTQLVTLEENRIFIIPLDKNSEASVLIKNSKGSIERKVQGGALGVVLDTRDKTSEESHKVGLDAIIQALNKL